MTLRLSEIIVDCRDPQALADFWCGVLGYAVVDDQPDLVEIRSAPMSDDELVAAIREGSAVPAVVFLRNPDTKSGKNRLHLDLSPVSGSTADEVERVVGLGAVHVDVGQPADASFVVLADPEGNEFCVLRSLAPGFFPPAQDLA